MRSLTKSPEPDKLILKKVEWTDKYCRAVSNGASAGQPWAKEWIREALNRETSHRCAYCDCHIRNVAQAHIEHYRPRVSYPHLVVDWNNLTIACPRCNMKKLDKFSDSLPFINPFLDDPRDHFVFFGSLVEGKDERGEYTVKILELNTDDVVSARGRRLAAILSLAQSWKRSSPDLKDVILSEIIQNYENGEYKSSVLGLLEAFKIPFDFDDK